MRKKHLAILVLSAFLLSWNTPTFAQETELLKVLQSDASLQEKSAACRQLARIATKESIPTLAGLLHDDELSHMARYALEPIDDPAVDVALREALSKIQGRLRLGVIGSLGVRRDEQAVDSLAALLGEAETARAAARALGNIGSPSAAKALEDALPKASDGDQQAICEGLLRCAETLAIEDQSELSREIYDRLRNLSDASTPVRAAALRGAVLTRGPDGVPLLVEAIEGPDYALAAAAVRTAMELSGPEITDALVAELSKASAERKGLLILALADRGESRVLPAVLETAESNDPQLRMLAFRALKRIGDASCVPALLEASVRGDDEIAEAALSSLESLQDDSVDDQIVDRLSDAEGKMRLILMDLAGRRRTAAAAPALWRALDDGDTVVRIAALNSLGSVLEAAELPRLIERFDDTKSEQEAAALDEALRSVGSRAEDRDQVATQIAAALPTADAPAKSRILETLNVIGGSKSLEATAAAAQSDDEELRDAAFRVLGQWKESDAAPILLKLHNAVTDERLKIRAIRAYIRIARQFNLPADQRAEMCRTALETADRDEDKRLVLEVLLRYPTDEMKAIAMEAAKVPALRDEAMLVVMGMSSKGINRAELGRALAQAGKTPVELEIIEAEYGAGEKTKDVTDTLREYAKDYRIIFLPSANYNESFSGDPAPGDVKQLKIKYRINGKDGAVTLSENAIIVLPMP